MIGGGSSSNSSGPTFTGLQIQTSALGLPVPLVYGANRVSGNLIWYGDFQQQGGGNQGGGKGGGGGGGKGGGKGGNQQTTYSASVAIGICEGPIAGFGTLYDNKTVRLVSDIFTEYLGAYPQAPWGYLVSNHPAQALGYTGLAYCAVANLQLGNSAQLPNYGFETFGRLYKSGSSAGDADASLVLQDVLTNVNYGAGFPLSRFGTVTLHSAEAATVPAIGPFTITVGAAAQFKDNLSVQDAAGNLYTCVAASPGHRQYAFSAAGVYTFAAADAGVAVRFTYTSLSPLLPAYQSFTMAMGLWISPVYKDLTAASSIVDDITKATYSEIVWSGDVLTVVPRGTVAVTGNGFTYTPPGAPLYDLTEDDFLPNSTSSGSASTDDPVQVTRTRPADHLNEIKVECLDRNNQYNTAIVRAFDQALIDSFTLRTNTSQASHFFADVSAANTSAQLLLQREYVYNTFSFVLDARFQGLEPMDIVTLTDAKADINRVTVLITEVTENDDGSCSYIAEEYPVGLGAPPQYSFQSNAGFFADYNSDPGVVNTPLIFEPQFQLGGAEEVWVLASGGANWGGAQVWVSTDDMQYMQVGTLVGQGRLGVLSGSLSSVSPVALGPTIDQSNTLGVDIHTSAGAQLLSGSAADAVAGNTLCYVDGELISYKAATLTGAGRYNLTYLVRGMFGSPIKAHAAGSQFGRLTNSPVAISFSPDRIGTTLFIKLLSFNLYGGGQQALAAVSPYRYTIQGVALAQPLPNVTGLQQGLSVNDAVQITWASITDPEGIRPIDYEIRFGVSPQAAQFMGRTTNSYFLVPSDGTYWISAHYRTPQGLDVYSSSFQQITVTLPISGLVLLATYTGEVAPPIGPTTPWSGTVVYPAMVNNNALVLDGQNDYLSIANLLADPDILYDGAVQSSGSYILNPLPGTNPSVTSIVVQNLVAVLSYSFSGVGIYDNYLTIPDLLNDSDILSSVFGQAATMSMQYGFADVDGHGGWTPPPVWFPLTPGQAILYDPATGVAPLVWFRAVISTSNPKIQPTLTHLTLQVYAKEKSYRNKGTTTASVSGLTVQLPAIFANSPNILVNILNAQPGDSWTSTITNSGAGTPYRQLTIVVNNGGSPVVRDVSYQAVGI